MAELSSEPASTEAQATRSSAKGSCSGTNAAGRSSEDIRESVRERYAAAARTFAEQSASISCRGPVALAEAEFRAALADAGLVDVEIRPTHRVHEHAGSAIVRTRKT